MTQVIAITSQKGGVGKTTTAVNLAAAFAREGQRVLLIEVDPQGAILPSVGLDGQEPPLSLARVFEEDQDLGGAIMQTPFEGIDVIAAGRNAVGEELQLDRVAAAHPMMLREKIDGLIGRYDTILLDGPPTLGALTHLTLAAADLFLIPVQAEEYAYRTLDHFFAAVDRIRHDYNPELQCAGLLVTMVDLRTRMSVRVINQLHENFGDLLLMTMIPRTVSLQDMPVRGKPTLVHAASSRGGRAYAELAQELLSADEAADPVQEVEDQATERLREATLAARSGEAAVHVDTSPDAFPTETLISAFPSTQAPRRDPLDDSLRLDTLDHGDDFFDPWSEDLSIN